MNDPSGGIWTIWTPDQPKPFVGELIEVNAVTTFSFRPDLASVSWVHVGKAPMPSPRRITYGEFMSTAEDCLWVEVAGVVRQVEYLHATSYDKVLWMELALDGGCIDVKVPWDGSPVPPWLVDRRVAIRGIAGSEVNAKHQMIHGILYVRGLHDISTIDAAAEEPFAVSPVPIASLSQLPRFKASASLTLSATA